MPRNYRWAFLDKTICYEADCTEPRATSPRSGHVYQRCERHEREHRSRLNGGKSALRMDATVALLADRHRWARRVARGEADRVIAEIAAMPRKLPERCAACLQWELWTGRERECRGCLRGLRVLAENESWRLRDRR